MSITNIQTLHDLAETSLASYANLTTNTALFDDLQITNTGASFTTDQATQFINHYDLVHVQANVDWNGFSAAVFQDKQTGEKVFALRGTEFDRGLNQIGTDLVVADVLGIGASGYANLQAVEMYRYWKKLTTVGGQNVSYTDSELLTLFALKLGPVAGAVVLTTPVGQAAGLAGFSAFKAGFAGDVGIDTGVPGQSVIAAGEKVNVTGHSLGGHLALLFARLFPDRVDEVVTLNAPTFFSQGDVYLNSLGFPSTVNSRIARLEADGDGVSELGNVDPGTAIRIAQENNPGPIAAISSNHSSVNGVDALALMAVMAKLDTSKVNDAAGLSNLIRAGSNTPAPSYESVLDALRKQILGLGAPPTPISAGASDVKRSDLYTNFKGLTDSDTFKSLAGKVTLELATASDLATQARTDFGAFLSLNALSSVVIRTIDTTALAKLKQANETLAQQWEADLALTQAQKDAGLQSFTDVYLLDRQAMLQGVIAHNMANTDLTVALKGNTNADYTYTDFTSSQVIKFKGTAPNAIGQEAQQVMFGNDQDNGLVGSDATAFGLGDRLYGGAGNDYINANAGDDYLEGNAGADSLNGGEGRDTLLGGTDNDTLDGGKEADSLKGGAGSDTYILRASDSGTDTDTILDGDGQGLIKVFGSDGSETVLGVGGISRLANGTDAWQSDDKRFTYTTRTESDSSTTLSISGAGVSAVVKNFTSGNLGINLPGTAPAPSNPTTGRLIQGDLQPVDPVQYDELGNVVTTGAAAPDRIDTLYDSAGNDEIISGGGIDLVYGARGGDDWFKTGAGRDLANGGAGADLIELGSERDVAFGAGGNDRIYADTWKPIDEVMAQTVAAADTQADLMEGSDGDDTVVGDAGSDALFGGADKDLIVGGAGDDNMFGDMNAGNVNYLAWQIAREPQFNPDGSPAGTRMVFTGIDYQMAAQESADVLLGGAGADYMFAHGGDDYLDGGADNDYVIGGTGGDFLKGGAGDDELQGDGDANVTTLLNYAAATGHANDYLDGGEGNDKLFGDGADDEVIGGAGDDLMYGDNDQLDVAYHGVDYMDGGQGADTMVGGGGGDQMFGGDNNDVMIGDGDAIAGAAHGKDYLDGEDGDDQMAGDGNDDQLFGGAGNDNIWGDNSSLAAEDHGDDYIDGEDGDDALVGSGGNDVLLGGAGNDNLFGDDQFLAVENHGDDFLDGEEGNDYLRGYGGNDVLIGGAGDDTLAGEAGNDTIEGGQGWDQMAGGAGDDTYVINAGDIGTSLALAEFVNDSEGVNRIKLNGMSVDSMNLSPTTDSNVHLLETGQDSLFIYGLRNGSIGTVEVSGVTYTAAEFFGKTYAWNADQNTNLAYTTLQGGKSSDTLTGTGGNSSFAGGAGNDSLIGSGGQNTYRYGIGDGMDTITDTSPATDTNGQPQFNTLVFGANIAPQDLVLSHDGSALVIGFGPDQPGGVRLTGFDPNNALQPAGVDRFQFSNGTVLTHAQLVARGFDIVGGAGSETLAGTNLGDRLSGGAGNDTLTGGAGDDVYTFNLGDGQDVIADGDASAGANDTLRFGDYISPLGMQASRSGGDLTFLVGTSRVTLRDYFSGGANAVERIEFADGSQWTQADVLTLLQSGSVLDDLVVGDSGNNALYGQSGNDSLSGLDGDDVLTGGTGTDTLDGGLGNDTFVFNVGDGADTLSDAGGADTLSFGAGIAPGNVNAAQNGNDLLLNVNIVGQTGQSVTLKDYFLPSPNDKQIERIVFADGTQWGQAEVIAAMLHATQGNDILHGPATDDVIDGLGGNDAIYGHAGADTLIGGAGSDTLYGGAGSDTYIFDNLPQVDTIDETNGGDASDIDTLKFTGGLRSTDAIFHADGADLLIDFGLTGYGYKQVRVRGQLLDGNPANQVERFVFDDGVVLTAQDAKDEMLRGSGLADWMDGTGTGDVIAVGYGSDTVFGGAGDDGIHGGEGNDKLYGEAGSDTLYGDAGDDTLVGGDGNDSLDGGAGWDRLNGAGGNDVYVFGLGSGNDIITQDTSGADRVQLAVGLTPGNVTLHRVSSPPAADIAFTGDSLVIQLNNGSDQLWIANYFDPLASGYIETLQFADGTSWDYAAITSRLVTTGGVANTLNGTNKANIFAVDHWNDVINDVTLNDGDKVSASASYRLPSTIYELTLTGNLNLFGVGNLGNGDAIRGNDGDNYLVHAAGAGGDSLYGGKGNDVYLVRGDNETIYPSMFTTSWGGASMTELAGEGIDTLISGYWSNQLPDNVENLVLTTPNSVSDLSYSRYAENDFTHKLIGNALNNVLDASDYEQSASSTWWYQYRNYAGFYSIGTIRLDGGTGADRMIGAALDDTYVIDNSGDTVVELGVLKDGRDVSNDTVETPFETSLLTQFQNIENVTLVGSAAVNATGNAGNNRLDGSLNSAANRLTGGVGNDTYVVGLGDVVVELPGEGVDTVVVASTGASTVRLADYQGVENVRLQANIGALNVEGDTGANELTGSLGDNRLTGNAGNDTISDQYLGDISFDIGPVPAFDSDILEGGDGNDDLTSRGGVDTLDGGAGDDQLHVYYSGRNVVIRLGLGNGHDTLWQDTGSTLTLTVELMSGVGPNDVQLRRESGMITVTLTDGSSLSFREANNASLKFSDGMVLEQAQIDAMLRTSDRTTPTETDDLLFGTTAADGINALGGNDAVYTGDGIDTIDGGAGNDRLFGGAGADTLTGGVGNDVLAGGTGADVYRLSSGFGQDVIDDTLIGASVHGADDGAVDRVEFDAGVTPAGVVVYRQVSGSTPSGLVLALPATGDSVALQNAYAPGGAGAVELVQFSDGTQWDLAALKARIVGELGSDLDDTLTAPAVGSHLEGRGGNDTLTGSAGADFLDGGSGYDRMTGLAGDDIYVVDTSSDLVFEASRGGTDTVIISADYLYYYYHLADEVERLEISGTLGLGVTGNALNNTIIGNLAANILDGGAGSDVMMGGAGDDVYDADATGDVAVEAVGEGVDLVRSSASFTLGANVENLTLTGTAKITGTGNAQDNVLIGNTGINALNGGGGNDRLDGGAEADPMTGGAGDDTYVVDNISDTTVEAAGGGTDTVESSVTRTLAVEVERLVLTGGNVVNGTGNASNNWLSGNSAVNVLNGAAGADVMLGQAGDDTLQDTAGNNAFDGGAGNDTLVAGNSADLIAGGIGNDVLTLGAGTDIISFNRWDGADTLNAPASGAGAGEHNDTLSLGQVRFSDIRLARDGSDLVLKVTGTADSLRLKSWYLGTANQTINRLQVVVDSTSDYAAGSGDVLRSSRITTLDFGQLVAAYDAAKAANPSLGDWAPSNATLTASLVSSSDTAALGGSLAYRYAQDGTLGNVAYQTAVDQLTSADFAAAPQPISSGASLQGQVLSAETFAVMAASTDQMASFSTLSSDSLTTSSRISSETMSVATPPSQISDLPLLDPTPAVHAHFEAPRPLQVDALPGSTLLQGHRITLGGANAYGTPQPAGVAGQLALPQTRAELPGSSASAGQVLAEDHRSVSIDSQADTTAAPQTAPAGGPASFSVQPSSHTAKESAAAATLQKLTATGVPMDLWAQVDAWTKLQQALGASWAQGLGGHEMSAASIGTQLFAHPSMSTTTARLQPNIGRLEKVAQMDLASMGG